MECPRRPVARWIGAALWIAVAAPLSLSSGCHREEQPHVKTAAEIQSDIDRVQGDSKMPPQIKQMVLGRLQGQKQAAQKRDGGT